MKVAGISKMKAIFSIRLQNGPGSPSEVRARPGEAGDDRARSLRSRPLERAATSAVATALVLSVCVPPAAAGSTSGEICNAAKLQSAGGYAECRLKAESRAIRRGVSPVSFSKCDEKFLRKWRTIELSANGDCPTTDDERSMRGEISSYTYAITTSLSRTSAAAPTSSSSSTTSTTWVPVCGDCSLDPGEACDLSDLNGMACTSFGFLGGTLACSADCGFDTSGCLATHFTDTGLTVVDAVTGLEWEKKTVVPGSAHHVGNQYTWLDLMITWVGEINDENFAGHDDWHLPSPAELTSIVDYTTGNPAIDSVFGPTASDPYWTAAVYQPFATTDAWVVDFTGGVLTFAAKASSFHVRAVRSTR